MFEYFVAAGACPAACPTARLYHSGWRWGLVEAELEW